MLCLATYVMLAPSSENFDAKTYLIILLLIHSLECRFVDFKNSQVVNFTGNDFSDTSSDFAIDFCKSRRTYVGSLYYSLSSQTTVIDKNTYVGSDESIFYCNEITISTFFSRTHIAFKMTLCR
jgi:hypothetical protein